MILIEDEYKPYIKIVFVNEEGVPDKTYHINRNDLRLALAGSQTPVIFKPFISKKI